MDHPDNNNPIVPVDAEVLPARRAPAANEATVNITYAGNNGDLPEPVLTEASDDEIKAFVTEALRTGSVPGIPRQDAPDIGDFVVDRYAPNDTTPWARIMVRPKVPFGARD